MEKARAAYMPSDTAYGSAGRIEQSATVTGLPHIADVTGDGICLADRKGPTSASGTDRRLCRDADAS